MSIHSYSLNNEVGIMANKALVYAIYPNENRNEQEQNKSKECIFNCNKRFKNLWLQFFLSQNQGFMRLFEKTVLK